MAAKKRKRKGVKKRPSKRKSLGPKAKSIVLKRLDKAWNKFGRKEYTETGMSEKEFAEDAGRFIEGMENHRLVKIPE